VVDDDVAADVLDEWLRATALNDVAHMRDLLDEGAVSIDTRHPLGWTALHVGECSSAPSIAAAVHGSEAAVRLLVERGADVDARDEYSAKAGAGYEARFHRRTHMSTAMRASADFEGTTALHYAALNGHRRVVDLLLHARESACTPQIHIFVSSLTIQKNKIFIVKSGVLKCAPTRHAFGKWANATRHPFGKGANATRLALS